MKIPRSQSRDRLPESQGEGRNEGKSDLSCNWREEKYNKIREIHQDVVHMQYHC